MRVKHTFPPFGVNWLEGGDMNALTCSNAEEAALLAVSSTPDVMWGQPVFRGTRVPIESILAYIDTGMTLEQVQFHFPFVTEELVSAARNFIRMYPHFQGPSRSLGELNPHWKLISKKVIPPIGR